MKSVFLSLENKFEEDLNDGHGFLVQCIEGFKIYLW